MHSFFLFSRRGLGSVAIGACACGLLSSPLQAGEPPPPPPQLLPDALCTKSAAEDTSNGSSSLRCCAVGPRGANMCEVLPWHQHGRFSRTELQLSVPGSKRKWSVPLSISAHGSMKERDKPLLRLEASPLPDGFVLSVSAPEECEKKHCYDQEGGARVCMPTAKLCGAAGRYTWDKAGFPVRAK